MKKGLLLITFSMLYLGMYSQGVGLYYTKNGSKLSGDKPRGYRIAPDHGFAFGAFVDLRIAPDVLLSLQPGYQKIQSIIRIPDSQGQGNELKDTLDFAVKYITLPILFKINPVEGDRFYFIGGTQPGLILESITTNENGEEKDQESIMNDWNLSLIFGLGYRIPIKRLQLNIELRYEQGLINITDFGNPEELLSRTKLQGLNLTVGLGLPFSNKVDD